MSKQRESKSRAPSQQSKPPQLKTTHRKNSNTQSEQSHLGELKQKGKKVLKRLIPNQSMSLLKKLVQKGADNLKKQIMQNQRLLPALTTTKIQSQLLQPHPIQHNQFHQMNQQLTHSMLYFHSNVTQNIQNTNAEIVRAQTDKCYRRIPKNFFETDLQPQFLSALLTHDRRRARTLQEELTDHYDEVEFNVNQQVSYKMGIFMSFVSFLTSIGTLADMSIHKIQGTRAKNIVIKQIVVQRAERVMVLRHRKQEIEKYIKILDKLKKLKKLQNSFMSQVQAKGRISTLSLYSQYCEIHQDLKQYCCSRMLCKYWDVAYYIERGYHDSFSRSLKNYLSQIITLDQKLITDILTPNKSSFATVAVKLHSPHDPSVSLDESYEVEQDVELVCKHNIEREIVGTFKQGLHKCSYSTDEVCEQLRNLLANCENRLYMVLRGDTATLSTKPATPHDKKQALDKLTTGKYLRIVELWSERMKKVVRRQASIIDKALRATIELKRQHPEKEEVISSYLMQIFEVTFDAVDESMSHLITYRKFKQSETDSIRQVLLYEQQWKELVVDLVHSPNLWTHLQRHYQTADSSIRPQSKIVQGLLGSLTSSRRKIVELMIDSYNTFAIERLPLQLQEDDWRLITIPSNFYNTLGEVLYGRSFTKEAQKCEKMLSSSLLLERNSSILSQNGQELNEKQESTSQIPLYQLQVTETVVTIEKESFKIVGSSIGVVQSMQGYLEWVEQAGEGEKLQCTVLSKMMQFLIMYNTHVKDLILNKSALNFGKIKTKSITGKHLLIAYAQLKFFKTIGSLITNRFPDYAELSEIMSDRLHKNMAELSKKFRSILQLSIRESINKLVVDPRKEISWPTPQSTEIVSALNRSCDWVREVLDGKEIPQFVSVVWCVQYLEQMRGQYKSVYRQIMNSNGTRKSKDIDWTDNLYWKFKELQYMVQNLAELKDYLPGFSSIIEQLEQQRKKLEHPQ